MAGNSLQYGTVILDEPLQFLGWDEEAKYDGPNYIYTTFTLRVRGVYNPAAISYQDGPNIVPQANFQGGEMAPVTDVALRDYLMQPRRTLTVTIGGTTALTSPSETYTVDAANGPFPMVNSITEVRGVKTFIVDFSIQTHVNEASKYVSKPTVMTSLLWSMEQDIDQDFFTTQTISGHAIFRSDILKSNGLDADDYRAYLFHPIPAGFKRDYIAVSASDDGLELDYTLIDRQQAVTVIDPNTTRIEASHTISTYQPGREAVIKRNLGTTVEGLSSILSSDTPWGAVGTTGRALAKALESAYGLIPRVMHHISCRAWGFPTSTRAQISQACVKLVLSRITNLNLNVAETTIAVTHDLMGKFVWIDATVNVGPIQGLLAGGVAALSNNFPANDGVVGVTSEDAGAISPAPPNDKNSRGTLLNDVAAQVLLTPQQVPPAPQLAVAAFGQKPP